MLHLNGYKIANPTVLARIGDEELMALLTGYGHKPYLVRGDDPAQVHQELATAMDAATADIARIQAAARQGGETARPRWPMIVLATRKKSTGSRPRAPGAPTRCRWPTSPVTPGTCVSSSSGCGATGPRSCSTRTARYDRTWPRCRQPGRHG